MESTDNTAPVVGAGDPSTPAGEGASSESGESAGTEQRIFKAATEVFARKGQAGARMREIAEHAEINPALLHYYFRSKSQLYEAVFAHGFKQFMGGLGQSLKADLDFEESLRTFVHGYIDYIHTHQDMARLMLNECTCGGPILERYLTAAVAKRDEMPGLMMEDRIVAAIESGEIRPVDPQHTMLTIVSSCLFPFVALPTVRIFHPEAADDFEAFVEGRKKHVVDLLLSGLRPAGSAE